MQIKDNSVVTLHYTLTDSDGNVLDKSNDGSFVYLHGSLSIVEGLEDALLGKSLNDEFSVTLEPEKGFGTRDDSKTQSVPRDMFQVDDEINPGMQFHAEDPDGNEIIITVIEVADDNIIVDGNHPLAGKTLTFDVKVVDIRDATDEEISHGHIHGPGGHHH